MIEALIKGLGLGLTVAISMGPAFFRLLQKSISHGFLSGIFLAIGIISSDLVLVILSNIFLSAFIPDPDNSKVLDIIGIVGGSVMIVFGIFTFLKKAPKAKDINGIDVDITRTSKRWKLITEGFILNFANPLLIIFWMGSMSIPSSKWGLHSWETFAFFATTLITIFGTDILKCFIAGKIKKYIRPRIISIVNYILGAVLILIGIYLILDVSLSDSRRKIIENKIKTEIKAPL